MFAIYYFHISPFFLFQFPHLFLSGGQISNAPKHHPDVRLYLRSIPTPPSRRAALEMAQEPARLGEVGMERQGCSCAASFPALLPVHPGGTGGSEGSRLQGDLALCGPAAALARQGDTLTAAFLGLMLQLSWVSLQIRN